LSKHSLAAHGSNMVKLPVSMNASASNVVAKDGNFIGKDNPLVVSMTKCASLVPKIDVDLSDLQNGFGQVGVGKVVQQSILIANYGDAELNVSDFKITGVDADQFSVTTTCNALFPNAACVITVSFAPTSIGAKSAELTFSSGDPLQAVVTVPLSGEGLDTNPPVITLNGESVVTLEVNTPYLDAGALAFDEEDGNLTSKLVTQNPVDSSRVGIYQVTYDVSDVAGNPAATVIRTVRIVDTTPPVASLSLGKSFLWPPNHKEVEVGIDWSASDSGSGVGEASIKVVDEYGKYTSLVPGDRKTIALEAWREGKDLDGRIYTVTLQVKDTAGNVATAIQNITVPHDMR
jgi:hypothetical protein